MFARITFIDHKYPEASSVSYDAYSSEAEFNSGAEKISSEVISINLPQTCDMSEIYSALQAARPELTELV